jgi:DNA-binding transcriptional MerR regulator
MLFGKKKEEGAREVPIDEVQKMTKKGMSDKDIIKQLKSKGYSYEAIESAMLKAVKDGVDDDKPKMVERMDVEPPATENMFGPQEETMPDFMQSMPDLDISSEQIEGPEVMLEELVEGIVEEKWRKFDDQVRKMDESFDKIRAEIKQFDVKLEQTKKDTPTRDLDARILALSEQMEDVEARVGGLEKAFKQFLPSLTRNIESLSNMIHEMKEKQAIKELG